jgi:hypothetical protein
MFAYPLPQEIISKCKIRISFEVITAIVQIVIF